MSRARSLVVVAVAVVAAVVLLMVQAMVVQYSPLPCCCAYRRFWLLEPLVENRASASEALESEWFFFQVSRLHGALLISYVCTYVYIIYNTHMQAYIPCILVRVQAV